jgi:hypothetical protein
MVPMSIENLSLPSSSEGVPNKAPQRQHSDPEHVLKFLANGTVFKSEHSGTTSKFKLLMCSLQGAVQLRLEFKASRRERREYHNHDADEISIYDPSCKGAYDIAQNNTVNQSAIQ